MALSTALNLALWGGVIRPAQDRLGQWRKAQQLVTLRPTVEALLEQSDQLARAWRSGSVPSGDPQAVMQLLQRSADRHRVQLSGLDVRAAKAPIELEASGSFHRLANWIGELETISGIQVEQWTLTAAAEPDQPHHATLSLSAS